MWTLQNNVISAETNTIKLIFSIARLKTSFVQNVPNEAILEKFADPQTLTAQETDRMNNRK